MRKAACVIEFLGGCATLPSFPLPGACVLRPTAHDGELSTGADLEIEAAAEQR
jgi:hypothetical protein